MVYSDLRCDVAKCSAHWIADTGKEDQAVTVHHSGMGEIRPVAEKIESPIPKTSGLFADSVPCGKRLYGGTIGASGS